MTDDPVRELVEALPYNARRLLHVDHRVIAYARRAAEQHQDLARVAATVSAGVGKYTPAEAHRVMLFRLRRECGLPAEDEQEGQD